MLMAPRVGLLKRQNEVESWLLLMAVVSRKLSWKYRITTIMETASVIITAAMALFTALLAFVTFRMAREAKESSLRQIGVTTWLALEPRFDSKEMKRARKRLANQLDPYDPTKHDQISEEVLELFESIGTVYNLGLLNIELADSSFSYFANHWWEAAKSYIDQERRNKGDNDTLFVEFEKFVQKVRKYDPVIDSEALADFLNDEKQLNSD